MKIFKYFLKNFKIETKPESPSPQSIYNVRNIINNLEKRLHENPPGLSKDKNNKMAQSFKIGHSTGGYIVESLFQMYSYNEIYIVEKGDGSRFVLKFNCNASPARERLVYKAISGKSTYFAVLQQDYPQDDLAFVLSYVPGVPLNYLLHYLSADDTINLCKHVLRAVVALHELKYAHLFLTGTNIIVDYKSGDFDVKIIDFAYAVNVEESRLPKGFTDHINQFYDNHKTLERLYKQNRGGKNNTYRANAFHLDYMLALFNFIGFPKTTDGTVSIYSKIFDLEPDKGAAKTILAKVEAYDIDVKKSKNPDDSIKKVFEL